MSAKDIMNAMDMLDEEFVIEAKCGRSRKKRMPRRLLVLAAVIALAMILTFTVVAVSYGPDWFGKFFSERSKAELSQDQLDLIRDNTVQVGQTQTRDGYTITLESAYTDGKVAFFRFLLVASEGTSFDADWYGSPGLSSIVNEEGENFLLDCEGFYIGGGGWHFFPEERENELTLLYAIDMYYTGERAISDSVWTFYIDGLWRGYRDEEIGLRKEQLSDGLWSFQVRFPEGCDREIELISEPVTVLAVLGGARLEPRFQMDPVEIVSCRVRALTVEIYFRSEKKPEINGDFGTIFAVMKNGDRIELLGAAGAPNKLSYTFDAPLDLDQVAHLLFHDGTILPVE